MRSLLWLVFLSHVVGCADMEPLQLRQCGCQKVPRLAAVKEDGLHNCLVELGAYLWRSVIRLQYLAYPSPYPPSLPNLAPYCLDVIFVLDKDPSEASKQIHFL